MRPFGKEESSHPVGRVSVVARLASMRIASLLTLTGAGDLAPAAVALKRREKELGQNLIEFALIMPAILVFLLFIVDFGLALDRREVIQHGVREGARAGATGLDEAKIEQITDDQSGGILEGIDVCYVDVDNNGIPGNAGDYIRVSGTYVYSFTADGGSLLGDPLSITMNPSSEARLETSVPGADQC